MTNTTGTTAMQRAAASQNTTAEGLTEVLTELGSIRTALDSNRKYTGRVASWIVEKMGAPHQAGMDQIEALGMRLRYVVDAVDKLQSTLQDQKPRPVMAPEDVSEQLKPLVTNAKAMLKIAEEIARAAEWRTHRIAVTTGIAFSIPVIVTVLLQAWIAGR